MNKTDFPYGGFDTCAVITGAAGGMGRVYAGLLAESGYSLILADISGERLEVAADEIRTRIAGTDLPGKEKFRILTLAQDLSCMDAASKVGAAASEFGCPVEILINNAGLFFMKEIAAADRKQLSLYSRCVRGTPDNDRSRCILVRSVQQLDFYRRWFWTGFCLRSAGRVSDGLVHAGA